MYIFKILYIAEFSLIGYQFRNLSIIQYDPASLLFAYFWEPSDVSISTKASDNIATFRAIAFFPIFS